MLSQLLILLLLLPSVHSAKIIVFNPRFSYSHVSFMGRIADELQLAGHNVVRNRFITTYYRLQIVLQAAVNLKCQDVGSKHAKVCCSFYSCLLESHLRSL